MICGAVEPGHGRNAGSHPEIIVAQAVRPAIQVIQYRLGAEENHSLYVQCISQRQYFAGEEGLVPPNRVATCFVKAKTNIALLSVTVFAPPVEQHYIGSGPMSEFPVKLRSDIIDPSVF